MFVCIRAEDVILETSPRGDVSARNQLTGRVTAIQPEGGVVRVTVDCGFSLSALITRPACEELRLTEGSTITAGDDGGQRLIADAQPDLAEQAVDAAPPRRSHAGDCGRSARRSSRGGLPALRDGPGADGVSRREQAVDLRLRQAMMAASRRRRADLCPGKIHCFRVE